MKEKIEKFREYLDYIEEHYNNVQKAWELIQEKCKDFHFIYDDYLFFGLDLDIKNHDLSKLSPQEFTQYRQYFFPCRNEKQDKKLFKQAWEHHKAMNDHHWQTWTLDGFGSAKQELALIHNIVDWVAMGFKFNDTAKGYYEKNKHEINLPDWAVKLMYEIFDRIYPLTQEDKSKYPIGGYAPGNYQNRCVTCDELFTGDKLARQCESCAKDYSMLEKKIEELKKKKVCSKCGGLGRIGLYACPVCNPNGKKKPKPLDESMV